MRQCVTDARPSEQHLHHHAFPQHGLRANLVAVNRDRLTAAVKQIAEWRDDLA